MRCKYREVRTDCGDYLDVDVFPVFRTSSRSKRGKRYKPTSETMARYNQRRRATKLERLVLLNFSGCGLFFNPTWSNQSYPASDALAKRDIVNFFRRLKSYRRKHCLTELKYIYKLERGKRSGRLHAHMILNCCDMPLGVLDEIWGKGYCYSSKLRCDDCGCPGLAEYFCKGKKKEPYEDNDLGSDVGYSWVPSHNLEKPKQTKRDGRITRRLAAEICTGSADSKRELERLYPGYDCSEARLLYNEINGGYYITARMRKRRSSGKRGP